ncbi:MAG: type I-C CRISPR-associated endonuclease Cas1c [Chloroherpetonaceae bacterium]|nr:type I-C CRISPR-associated endonuclease Cas1c [Chloroherpetonaceae bacterium]
MNRLLLNTLYVMTPGAVVRLDGDTARIEVDRTCVMQVPLLHLGALVLFGSASVSSPLMQRCAEEGRTVTFLDYAGRFKCRVVGPTSGNVLLRKAQYEAYADDTRALAIARPIVAGKIRNSRQTLLRAAREMRYREATTALTEHATLLVALQRSLVDATVLDEVRGIEGQAAAVYFDAFGAMITRPKSEFAFVTRTRRPPRDRVNALLSFVYALLTTDCVTALEGVGLDPQFGYLHAIRPGRPALALDLMEEFRSYLVDRLVLSLINRRQITPEHFEDRPGESVLLTADGRKIVLTAYQERKQQEVMHPFLRTKAPIGLLPHLQARLLARHLRGDLPAYLPFMPR